MGRKTGEMAATCMEPNLETNVPGKTHSNRAYGESEVERSPSLICQQT